MATAKAYAAFDLDLTLGCFEYIYIFAYLWSPEFLENPEMGEPNPPLKLSKRLEAKLQKARSRFAHHVLADPELLELVLRPNLDALIRPLLVLKRAGVLKAAVIYSNTNVNYTMEFAKILIERRYRAPGFFSMLVDQWHPIREDDVARGEAGDPVKQMATLEKIFRRAVGEPRRKIRPADVVFVDDREPKHLVAEAESEGLTYIKVMPFCKKLTEPQRDRLLLLAFTSLQEAGVFETEEYMNSGFCHRNIPYDNGKIHRVNGFESLMDWITRSLKARMDLNVRWVDDTLAIDAAMGAFVRAHGGAPNL